MLFNIHSTAVLSNKRDSLPVGCQHIHSEDKNIQ